MWCVHALIVSKKAFLTVSTKVVLTPCDHKVTEMNEINTAEFRHNESPWTKQWLVIPNFTLTLNLD